MEAFLILIGIILIIYGGISIRKQKLKNDESRDLFKNVLEKNENELTDYQLEIGKLRKYVGESLSDLQQEILEIKIKLDMIKENDFNYDNIENDHTSRLMEMTKKTLDISELIEKGYKDEDICKELSVTKGEILLVRNLYMK